MKKAFKYIFRLLLVLIGLIIIWGLWNRKLVSYGWMQLKGQLNIVYASVPVDQVLNDPLVNDSTKARLNFLNSVRRFAIDSLGLKDSKNYTTYFDQHSKPLLWVLTASEPYQLKAYHWKFPVVGEVSYKGYFNKEVGMQEDSILLQQGFDTDIGEVSAWSTLGWFRDPILSGMLRRSDGQLAELLIHEMTHATLYVKSDVDFNENLASAVAEAGAVQFLNSHYGSESSQLQNYLLKKEDTDMFTNHMLSATKILDTLYIQIAGLHDSIKTRLKNERMVDIVKSLDTLTFHFPKRYNNIFVKQLPNNAYFLSFIRYDAQKAEMREELKIKFSDNISKYLVAVRNRYD